MFHLLHTTYILLEEPNKISIYLFLLIVDEPAANIKS